MATRTTLTHQIIDERAAKHLRIVSWLAAPLWIFWIGFDYLFANELFFLFLPFRILGTLVSIITIYLLDKISIHWLHRAMYTYYIIALTSMMVTIDNDSLLVYFMGYAMVVMILFFVLILTIPEIIYFALLTAFSFIFILFFSEHEKVEIMGNGGFVFVTIFLVMVFISGIRYSGLQREIELIRQSEQADLILTSNERLAREIEERKQIESNLKLALEEKEILLKEVHHRVKNNLQVISSILSLQSSTTSDANSIELLAESRRRIRAMALIHEKLYTTRNFSGIDFGEYLVQLAHDLVNSYSMDLKHKPTLEISCDALELKLDQAIPLGLILNELITNAIKYGKSLEEISKITIEMMVTNNQVILSIRDNGTGFNLNQPIEFNQTLGIQLIRTLTEQLDGQVSFSNHENGGAWIRLEFPYLN
jgi:two-component sensor histidine kinase